MSTPIILDTDIGSDIDDVFALALALNHPGIRLLGVTTVGPFPQSRARLAAKLLRVAGRENVPVYSGHAHALPQESHAVAARRSRPDSRRYTSLVETHDPENGRFYDDAVKFMLATLDRTEEPVTLIGVGGWTNVAEVIRRASSAQLERIGLIAMMGGDVHSSRREANACFDPEATRSVLESELPTFVATWSPSREVTYTMAEIEELASGEQSPLVTELYRGTKMWFNPSGIKPGPVCYDVVPVFWAAGERDAITCIKLSSIPVETTGTFTSGLTVCEPWTIERAERTREVSGAFNTVTHKVDADALKRSFNKLVFGGTRNG